MTARPAPLRPTGSAVPFPADRLRGPAPTALLLLDRFATAVGVRRFFGQPRIAAGPEVITMYSLATLALATLLPQQAVEHPLPPRTEQPPGVVAVVGATLHPVSSPPVQDGVMLVENGRIRAIGADVEVPSGATVLDLAGMTVMPGIVESHSHMGLKRLYRPEAGSDNNELSKPINAEVRAIDGLATQDAAFGLALAAGVTTMQITTGSRSFASGQGAVVKLRGRSVGEMWLAEGGLKFAMRIQSRNRWRTPVPEILVMLRERLREAQGYRAAVDAHESGQRPGRPAWDPQLEALGRALARGRIVWQR